MGRDFLACITPLNTRLGFIAITCDNQVAIHTIRDGIANTRRSIVELEDKLGTVLIAANDEYAVILGQSRNLSIYVVDLDEKKMGWSRKVVLDAPKNYVFDSMHDAASLLEDGKLRISYRKGHTVTFDLGSALELMRSDYNTFEKFNFL
jgi:predicted lipase